MTRLQMRDRVLLYLRNRPGHEATINSVLNEKTDGLAMPFFFPHLDIESDVATVAGTNIVTIPSLVYVAQKVLNLDAPARSDKRIDVVEQDWIDSQDWEYTYRPKYASQFGTKLYLWPTPDVVYDLRVRGRRLPTPMDDDLDEPELPRDWHPIIAKLAASEMHFALGEDERAMAIKNEALGEISARQEVRTMQRRGQEGQIQIARKLIYRRGGIRGSIEE